MHDPPHRYVMGAEGEVDPDAGFTIRSLIPLFYTGLTDAEGTLIYEGDVVGYWSGERDVVRWGDYLSAFTLDGVIQDAVQTVLEDCEVIGNRYEDPDLLEENPETPV
jgi:YopX protein.